MPDKEKFDKYIELFLTENNKVNLISQKDEKFIWEKHIYDSLAIEKVFDKYAIPHNILDFGTGGGFPSVPLAIYYPQIKVTALDSIAKKIKAVQYFKEKLNLDNLETICTRVENYNAKFDMVTSRAVSSLKNICEYGLPKLNKNGYFIAYKSKKAQDEISEAKSVLKKYNAEVIDIIEYTLPLKEKHERNLIVIKFL